MRTSVGGITEPCSGIGLPCIVWGATAPYLSLVNGLVTVRCSPSTTIILRVDNQSLLTDATAVISYFLGAVLDTAGISNPITQTNINLGLYCLQFVLAILGASLVDRIGRRPLLLFTNAGCCITWLGITVATADYARTGSAASAKATVGLIYIFGMIFSIGFTPLQALYPVEVLSFEMRAKGMAFSNFAVSAGKFLISCSHHMFVSCPFVTNFFNPTTEAGLLNQFAWPVALERIAWKTYICFTVWCAVQTLTIYFLIPETKNRTVSLFFFWFIFPLDLISSPHIYIYF